MKFSVIPTEIDTVLTFVVVVDLCNPKSTDNVTIEIGTTPTGSTGVLSGTTTVAAINGVAFFDDLGINDAGDGYTLVATAPQQLPPVGQFQPGVMSAAPCCDTGGCYFQAGYYYNYPPCGTIYSHNSVSDGAEHANLNPEPVTESVVSNPFNVV